MAKLTDNLNKKKADSSASKPFRRAPIVGIDIPADEAVDVSVPDKDVEEKVRRKPKAVAEEAVATKRTVKSQEETSEKAPKKAVKKDYAPKVRKAEKSKKNMVVKFIFGIVVLIIFVIFAYISISVAPHTSDVPDDYETGENLHRGVERQKDIVSTPVPAEDFAVAVETATAEESAATPEPTEGTSEVVRPEVLKAQSLGLPEPPEIDINSWEYLLVNSTHTIGEDFRPETFAALSITMDDTDIEENTDGVSSDRCLVDYRIGEALRDFALACKEAGNPVYLSSGYRSYADQSYLYQRKVSQGYTEDVAKTIVAYPGTSEHQTGLCCDITDYYRETKDSSLEETDTYKWLVENCADYGFVVRYPEDKSGSADSITGIIFEPWHFRYVGKEAAKYMTENNLCLEEFVALYE